VEQKQPRISDRDTDKRDSAKREMPRRPSGDRAYAGDRPSTAQEGGLLRQLKETPRHLD
jgi:hypothetical protein